MTRIASRPYAGHIGGFRWRGSLAASRAHAGRGTAEKGNAGAPEKGKSEGDGAPASTPPRIPEPGQERRAADVRLRARFLVAHEPPAAGQEAHGSRDRQRRGVAGATGGRIRSLVMGAASGPGRSRPDMNGPGKLSAKGRVPQAPVRGPGPREEVQDQSWARLHVDRLRLKAGAVKRVGRGAYVAA